MRPERLTPKAPPPPKHWTSQVQDHLDTAHSRFFGASHGRMKDMHQAQEALRNAPEGSPEKERLAEELKAKQDAYHGTRIGRMNQYADQLRGHVKAGQAGLMDAREKLMDKNVPMQEKTKLLGEKYNELAGRFRPHMVRRSLDGPDMPRGSPALRRRSFDDDFVGAPRTLRRRSLDDDAYMYGHLARRDATDAAEGGPQHPNIMPGTQPHNPPPQNPEAAAKPKAWGDHAKEYMNKAPGQFHQKFKDNAYYQKAQGYDKYWSANKHYQGIKEQLQKHGQKAHEYLGGAANKAQESFSKVPFKDRLESAGKKFMTTPHFARRSLEFGAESDRLMAQLERRAAFEGRVARVRAAEEY